MIASPASCKSFAVSACVPSRPVSCACVRCRLSCSCATASCWTSGSCRRISPTSWRAPWCTTPATAHKCGASSATCSCTSGKATLVLCCWECQAMEKILQVLDRPCCLLCAVWSSWASTLCCSSWLAFLWRWFTASYGSVSCTWQECSLVRIL